MTFRTGIIFFVATIVAASSLLFGAAYVSGDHVERAGENERTAVHGEGEHREEAHEDGGAVAIKILGALMISVLGAAIVPLSVLLLRRHRRGRLGRRRQLLPATRAACRDRRAPIGASGQLPLPGVALLSAGAATIHFVVAPEHWTTYSAYGAFFVAAAAAQLGWSIWILTAPSRLIYMAGALGNALIVGMWIVSRTAGVPIGPDAGEREAAALADVVATTFEAVVVVAAVALSRSERGLRPLAVATPLMATATLALVVAALTATSLLSLVEL